MTIFKVSSEILQIISELEDLMNEKIILLQQHGIFRTIPNPTILFSELSVTDLLGYYDKNQNAIVLSINLLGHNSSIENVFLHELAHYIDCTINNSSRHDKTFSNICNILGVDENFIRTKAKTSIDEFEKRKKKIQKLLNLSSSDFENEAENAILKAQALMEKWDIKLDNDEDSLFGVQVTDKKRSETWMGYLAYSVSMITGAYSIFRGKGKVFFYGTLEQVEAAMYIFDSLCQIVKKKCDLIVSSLKAFNKHAYISRLEIKAGICSGFQRKIREQNNTQIIVRYESNGDSYKRIYDHIVRKKRTCHFLGTGYELGKSLGHDIDVPSVKKGNIVKRITD